MLNGSRDISNLSFEWQRIVLEVLGMRQRIKFGIAVLDQDLDERMKIAIEACQTAIDSKEKK